MNKKHFSSAIITIVLFFFGGILITGQEKYQPAKVTTEDYSRAESFLSAATNPLIYYASVRPNWVDKNLFWYRNTTQEGNEFILVDVKKKKRLKAFDHQKLANAFGNKTGKTIDPNKLPFSALDFDSKGKLTGFSAQGKKYSYDSEKQTCEELGEGIRTFPSAANSPDGTMQAFIKDHNLWVRNLESGDEKQLTKDGIQDFGYATNNAGWTKSNRPILLWSPDSKKIATFQHDGRGVGEMYMATTNIGHPELEAWKYPLPEDTVIFRIHRVVIHVGEPRVVRLKMNPDQHRSTITDHIATRGGTFADVEWSNDASSLAFVSSSRDHKNATLRVADAETGEVRDVLEENVKTFFESGFNMTNWHYLPESNEILWFSQRDNWGHLYLYDLKSGKQKHQITKGDWNVLQVLKINEDKIFFIGAGKEPGDPYFQYFYSVKKDGNGLSLLTPDSANHSITLSPLGDLFIDSYSTPVYHQS